jgi:hypothetical protein
MVIRLFYKKYGKSDSGGYNQQIENGFGEVAAVFTGFITSLFYCIIVTLTISYLVCRGFYSL